MGTVARRLAESPHRTPVEPVNRTLPRRQGWVWPAIRRVLPAADAPMQPVAIYAAVVDDLDRPISKSTIKNDLRRRLTIVPLKLRHDGNSGYSLIGPSR